MHTHTHILPSLLTLFQEELAAQADASKKVGKRDKTMLSGRALFKYDPAMFVDDADADDAEEERDVEEEEVGASTHVNVRFYQLLIASTHVNVRFCHCCSFPLQVQARMSTYAFINY
jgi:hypothetical protein